MKKLIALFVFVSLLFCAAPSFARELKIIEALGDYPRPAMDENGLFVSFLRASEGLKHGQPVIVEVSFGNHPAHTTVSVQWVQDGNYLADGYYSEFDIGNGATMTYSSVLPYYGPAGTKTRIGFYISVGGGPLSLHTIEIPFIEGVYLDDEAIAVLQKVKPVVIGGTIVKTTPTYSDSTLKTKKGTADKGPNVFYIDRRVNDDEIVASYVQFADGSHAWIPPDTLIVTNKNLTSPDNLTDREKEIFVNAMCYASQTPYLVWVNVEHQKVNVFLGEQYKWVLLKSFLCSTGTNLMPTPMGTYKYCGKDKAWIKEDYQVRPVLYFDMYRGLAFHSRLYSPDGSRLIDATIGRPASHGCIRMYDEDIWWMEHYLTYGTTVIVY